MTTGLSAWKLSVRNLFVGAALGLLTVMPTTFANAAETSDSSPKGVALQAASWLITVPYGAVKVVYALGGGIVGGCAWLVTGGNMEAAKSVWIPSMTGDYIVQPQNLTGERPLRFIGGSSEESVP